MNKTVYLAGPIKGASYITATDWRIRTQTALAPYGITTYSPLRAKDYLKNETKLNEHYDEHPLSQISAIISRDHNDVFTCDLIFANLFGADRVSIGTCFEIAWAYAYKKPAIVLMEKNANPHDHDFIKRCVSSVVHDEETAMHMIRSFLLP